jgi:hypothetical protein
MIRTLIPKPIRKQLARILLPKSPVLWTNWGVLSEILAKRIPPKQPPVVILSMPRSGSSWVGEILGLSPSSLYLREPITQTHLKMVQEGSPSFFEFDTHCLPEGYASAAANAFSGLPLFSRWITKKPDQWNLSKRKNKRILIKEVNPYLLKWFITDIKPKIIFLMRHPVAIASSFYRNGWDGKQFEFRYTHTTLKERVPEYSHFTHSFWAEHGALQAFMIKDVLSTAKDYKDLVIAKYEDLCTNPTAEYKKLFDFAHLEWNSSIEKTILEKCSPKDINNDFFSTQRNPNYEKDKWKKEVAPDNILELKQAYLSFDPPYYKDDWPE